MVGFSEHLTIVTTYPEISFLDATPKSKHETVVSYEFADDPTPPSTCCCGKVKIQVML